MKFKKKEDLNRYTVDFLDRLGMLKLIKNLKEIMKSFVFNMHDYRVSSAVFLHKQLFQLTILGNFILLPMGLSCMKIHLKASQHLQTTLCSVIMATHDILTKSHNVYLNMPCQNSRRTRVSFAAVLYLKIKISSQCHNMRK